MIRASFSACRGTVAEIGEVALPASVRRTTLYRTMVEVALRFMIKEVGGRWSVCTPKLEGQLAAEFLLQRR